MDVLLPQGIRLGNAQNQHTGVSVVICEEGMTGGIDVRGCAPGTRESDLLHPQKAVQKINAVALCGGSAYGLHPCSGIMRYLKEKNSGYIVGNFIVPLVSAAVIFDLKEGYYLPDSDMGYAACVDAKQSGFSLGKIGVGTGATIGKIAGVHACMAGGLGGATILSNDVFVTAITVVNALGDVYEYTSGKIVAGARHKSGQFIDSVAAILQKDLPPQNNGGNTTLSIVITNADLTKLQANKLACIAHDGLALSIRPVHTDYDGDTIFALSKGDKSIDFTKLSCMAVEAVAKSVVNAVKH